MILEHLFQYMFYIVPMSSMCKENTFTREITLLLRHSITSRQPDRFPTNHPRIAIDRNQIVDRNP